MFSEDSISLGLTIVAIMILLYLSTFVGFSNLLLIPAVLLISGVTLQMYITRRVEHDESFSQKEIKNVLLYTVMALVGIGIGSVVSSGLFNPPQIAQVQMQVQGPLLYGILYAVSEEVYFRGFITSFLMWKIPGQMIAHIASGSVFAIYHFAVYGSSPDKIVYVLFAGTILSYVVARSGRISPSMLAHIANNIMAGGVIS